MFKKTLIVFLITLVASIFGAIATYDHSVYAQIPGLTDSQQEPQSQEQQGQQQQQTFLTFENPTYKFKIQYPSDWQVKPVGRSPPSGAIAAAAFVSSDNATLTVTVQNLSQYLDVNDLQVKKRTAQDYAKEAFATLSAAVSGIKPIRISQTTAAGYGNAWKTEYMFVYGGAETYDSAIYIAEDNGLLYVINFSSPSLKVPVTLPVAQKMIDSFQTITKALPAQQEEKR